MTHLMTVLNNDIYGKVLSNNTLKLYVRDNSDKRNVNKKAEFIFDGNQVKVISTDFNVNRTSDMLTDIKKNLRFILEVI